MITDYDPYHNGKSSISFITQSIRSIQILNGFINQIPMIMGQIMQLIPLFIQGSQVCKKMIISLTKTLHWLLVNTHFFPLIHLVTNLTIEGTLAAAPPRSFCTRISTETATTQYIFIQHWLIYEGIFLCNITHSHRGTTRNQVIQFKLMFVFGKLRIKRRKKNAHNHRDTTRNQVTWLKPVFVF